MEQDDSADDSKDTQNEFDIVLLHEEETQTAIAEMVCNNIRQMGRRYGVDLRVKPFGQLQLGKQALAAADHVIVHSSIIMFFADKVCLSDETNRFAAYASVSYKIQLPSQRQQWTTIPVVIEGNSKVVNMPVVSSLSGLKVSASGVLDRTNENKLICRLRSVLQIPFHDNWPAGRPLLDPSRSIAENRAKQANDISKLVSPLESNQSALPPCVEADSQAESPEEQVRTPGSGHRQGENVQRRDQRMPDDPAPLELRQIWNQQGARPKHSQSIPNPQSSAGRPKHSKNSSNTQSSAVQTQLPARHGLSSVVSTPLSYSHHVGQSSTPGPDLGFRSQPVGNTSAVGVSREEAAQRASQGDEEENRPHTEALGGHGLDHVDDELLNAEENLSNVSLCSDSSSGEFSDSDAPSSVSENATARRGELRGRPSQGVPNLQQLSQARIDPQDGGPLEEGDSLPDRGNHRPNFDLMPEDERAELQDLLL